jgi:hypothetical protein
VKLQLSPNPATEPRHAPARSATAWTVGIASVGPEGREREEGGGTWEETERERERDKGGGSQSLVGQTALVIGPTGTSCHRIVIFMTTTTTTSILLRLSAPTSRRVPSVADLNDYDYSNNIRQRAEWGIQGWVRNGYRAPASQSLIASDCHFAHHNPHAATFCEGCALRYAYASNKERQDNT